MNPPATDVAVDSTSWTIFISWSGSPYGEALAKSLKDFFTVALGLEAFMSKSDISPADEWRRVLDNALKRTSFWVLALTKTNYLNQWPIFEAATMLAHKKRGCVILFDKLQPSEIPPPLAHLHFATPDLQGMQELVKTIKDEIKDIPITHQQHQQTFFNFAWNSFANDVSAARKLEELPRARQASECPILPSIIQELYDKWLLEKDKDTKYWSSKGKSDPNDGNFKLYTFSGIGDKLVLEPVHEINPFTSHSTHYHESSESDHEKIYHLWADAEGDSFISAHVKRNSDKQSNNNLAEIDSDCKANQIRYLIRFHNHRDTHPSNVAFRPTGRTLLIAPRGEVFRRLAFRVRIPKTTHEESKEINEIVFGIRVMDRNRVHWMYCHNNTHKYLWQQVNYTNNNEWKWLKFNLAKRLNWCGFEFDGNPIYYDKDKSPDFSIVMAVIIEFAKSSRGVPTDGGGVVEIADFIINPAKMMITEGVVWR